MISISTLVILAHRAADMGILRGCLGYGGAAVSISFKLNWSHVLIRLQLLQHKGEILELLTLMIERTKSERGYAGTGRLIHRIMHTLVGVYPIDSRFVNSDEWDDPGAYARSPAVVISYASFRIQSGSQQVLGEADEPGGRQDRMA